MGSRSDRSIRQRAGYRCEYCHVPASHDPLPFELDHIIPLKHGGADDVENRALSCFPCNRAKGSNLTGLDRLLEGIEIVRLYDPRRDKWSTHFRVRNGRILGRTPIGRVTIATLNMNRPDRIEFRNKLLREGVRFD